MRSLVSVGRCCSSTALSVDPLGMLHDLSDLRTIEVDVYTWLALVSACGGDERKISASATTLFRR